ncbi:MAG: DUF4332 domain-containing protein [Spirochaetia bacterium]|nr:DUF4332 domain-containing protein [Spirochaetia bacterium]
MKKSTDKTDFGNATGKLNRIVTIDDDAVQKLKSVGVTTLEKFLARASSPVGRQSISRESRINEKLILKWVYQADLFRIKGLAGNKAELLGAVGVKHLKDLAKSNAEKLFATMTEYNDKKHIVQRVPGVNQIKKWIETAKKITPMVK